MRTFKAITLTTPMTWIILILTSAVVTKERHVALAIESIHFNLSFDYPITLLKHNRKNDWRRIKRKHHFVTKTVGSFIGKDHMNCNLSTSKRVKKKARNFNISNSSKRAHRHEITSKSPNIHIPSKMKPRSGLRSRCLLPPCSAQKVSSVSSPDKISRTFSLHDSYHHNPSQIVSRGGETSPLQFSSSVTSAPSSLRTSWYQFRTHLLNKVSDATANIEKQDFAIAATYVCAAVAMATPVILLPMIAADPFLSTTSNAAKVLSNQSGGSFIGRIISLSALGGALGKFVNGFVCKSIGGKMSTTIYLFGIAAFSLFLSITESMHGYAMAGMEFCWSIVWTACSVLFSNRCGKDPKKFTNLITLLSFGSTTGVMITKIFGAVLLRHFHWRQVARFASIASIIGATLMFCFVEDVGQEKRMKTILQTKGGSNKASDKLTLHSIINSLSYLLGNPTFWMVGFAHGTAMVSRQNDKLLGPFIRHVTGLPSYLCGTLTSSVTLGFVYGLISSQKIHKLKSSEEKRDFISSRYRGAALSAMGLALCGNQSFGHLLGSKALAATITLSSASFATCIAYQFYQFPASFGKNFGKKDMAICISILEGLAYLLVSSIWSMIGKILVSDRLGSHGWSIAWLLVASFCGVGGNIMMKNLSAVLGLSMEQKQNK